MNKTYLVVRGIFRGRHYWPEAVEEGFPQYSELHSHFFHFEVLVRVKKSRELEFNELAQLISRRMEQWLRDNESASCEDMAVHILQYMKDVEVPAHSAEVLEDGCSGARAVLDA